MPLLTPEDDQEGENGQMDEIGDPVQQPSYPLAQTQAPWGTERPRPLMAPPARHQIRLSRDVQTP